MTRIDGSSTTDIDAPIERVWALVADVERAPDWQRGLRDLIALERDSDRRATLCEAHNDAKVTTLRSTVRFTYEPPTRLSWVQERGDIRSVEGSWELEDLGDGRTRARYRIDVDLGRLGLVIRGPLVGVLRDQLAGARAGELKRAIEGSDAGAD